MKIIDINQALPQIMELIEMAFAGEEIIISKNNQQTIKITPVLSPQPRPLYLGAIKTGLLSGMILMNHWMIFRTIFNAVTP